MNNEMTKEIDKLQNNLQTIRKVAGWTTEELGERIGVTKQTISNLENKKTPLTKTQYIAIRAILDYEIATNPDSAALARVIDVLLNFDDESDSLNGYSDQKERELAKKKAVAARVGSLALMAAASPAVAGMTVGWLAKMLGDNKMK